MGGECQASDPGQTYIESRLPLEEISIECRRESSTGLHPPPNRLHVWWARRPLTASRAAVLGALLPSTVSDREFLGLLGVRGDPIAARRASEEARKIGKRLASNPFDYPRAFTVNLDRTAQNKVARLVRDSAPNRRPVILDPMAGGGSIPFEALRAGFRVVAGEINPVAYVILRATIEYPARFGEQLADEVAKWGIWVSDRARKELEGFFPSQNNEIVIDYIWARTVRCPSCGLVVPLSPNWWLSRPKGNRPKIGARPKVPNSGEGDKVSFEIIDIGKYHAFNPDKGTVDEGKGSCPRRGCGNTIAEDYIKKEAQQGRMGHQLYAVFVKKKSGLKKWEKSFRQPSDDDLKAYENAVSLLSSGDFPGSDLLPREHRFKGPADRSVLYGITHWHQAFNARQLITLASYAHYSIEAKHEIFRKWGDSNRGRAVALATYLSLVVNKCLNYDSILAAWNAQRAIVRSVFDRHDFGFTWSYGEMNMIPKEFGGFEWALGQVVDAYRGLCNLLTETDESKVKIFLGSSTEMLYIEDSVDAVVVDPPYYANVMYAELSDFFYVWMKRMLGDLYPGFDAPLTDKDTEVVANSARFAGLGTSAEEKAKEDYRLKMAQTFRQIHRVLKPKGILVVMFTHKATEAWDTLATALIDAGFQIKRSWPVRTEPEHSLNIARKNSVKSTIFLVARKRHHDSRRGWWEQEVYPETQKVAEGKAAEFEKRGISGVDLYISTFGPVLEVFSRYSEVKSMTGKTIRPEDALDVARTVVTNRTFQKLIPGGAIDIDGTTKFYILAMHFYRARQFPFDEARKLALSVGADTAILRDKEHVIRKKSEDVVILDAAEREHSGYIDSEKPASKSLIDAIHLAELAYQRGGLKMYQNLIEKFNLDANPDFRATLEALSEALPEADPEKKTLAPLLLQAPELRVKGSRIDDYSGQR